MMNSSIRMLALQSPSAVRLIAADIKLAHSVFAMPFALLAAFMAGAGLPGGATIDWPGYVMLLGLVVLAMFFARTCAMLANRLVDRAADARNPRTVGRALPSGRVTIAAMTASFVASAILFLLVCAAFGICFSNWWPLTLALPVLAWICSYGYLKRFTALCHLYLGSSLAISPVAAAIAIEPAALGRQPAIWLLGGMVLCWVAGFDIIYALQDVEVDRRDGLFSMPARWGVARAMWVSRALHALALMCLVAALLVDSRLELLFGVGIAITAALLVYEHLTVSRWGTTKIALAFFTLNGIISCLLGALGVVDVIWF